MRRIVLALSLLTLTLTACGSEPSATPPAGNQPNAAGNQAGATPTATKSDKATCPDAAVVTANLNLTVAGAPDVTNASTGSVCMYRGKNKATGKSNSATVGIRLQYSATEFPIFRKQETDQGYAVTDLPGLGDGAFTFATKVFDDTINNVAIYKGDRMVYVGSVSSVDQVTTLCKIVLGI